jgi:hypothetical protein
MTTTYAVLPDVCPGSLSMPKHYRAACYHGDMANPEGQCPSCGAWVPVAWLRPEDQTSGYRRTVAHEVRR